MRSDEASVGCTTLRVVSVEDSPSFPGFRMGTHDQPGFCLATGGGELTL